MDANFARAVGHRRWYDRLLMKGEWPVLLDIMGKGDGEQRYLSVAEVSTLFAERRLPDRVALRLTSNPGYALAGSPLRVLGNLALVSLVIACAAIVAIAGFPDQVRKILPTKLAQVLPPALPDRTPTKAAYWLDQNWSTEDRHWFHHASQGTATFPVPYAWFVALEQPGIHLFSQPGLLKDSDYLERFGFVPSPKSVHADETSLRRFGYLGSSDAASAPAPVPSLPPTPAESDGLPAGFARSPTPVENFDGLPVGFARLTGVPNPATGRHEPDRIGLTCAACHTGHISYKGVSVRFDGGPGMVDLGKLESATGLSILYTLYVPGRFERFATRVLGPDASKADRSKLKKDLAARGDYVLSQKDVLEKTLADKGQQDTEEGFGRLDALNRIGNQVFYTDLADGGLTGFERNLHARDAPVSFPPIWTVPWFLWAQYDASIQQPLVRNAGEALGVSALVNLSPDYPPEALFRSSVAIDNLDRIETMLRGPNPFSREQKSFGGLLSPKWPSQIFPDDPAWKIDPARVSKGRAIYAEICAECHLGPVDDPAFDTQFPGKGFWSSHHWKDPTGPNPVLVPVQKAGMGTDLAQASVLASRKVDVPSFLKIEPADNLKCPDSHIARASSTEMLFSLALMSLVDRVITTWMDDHPVPGVPESRREEMRAKIWGPRWNCPNPVSEYRARPLNGVWATAPYLHNGSVPSLYWLLKPAAERPKQFCIGARDFDPEQVGYRVASTCNKGETQFSTARPETLFSTSGPDGSAIHGNSVLGHSLEGTPGPDKPGVIGRLLTEEERYDLIEYLKTL